MYNQALYKQVLRKLNITWEDPETAERVDEIIASAIPDLIHKLGIADPDFDFSAPGQENRLFLSFCLYEWNHCANEFDVNYASDILQVQGKHSVARHRAENEVIGNAEE